MKVPARPASIRGLLMLNAALLLVLGAVTFAPLAEAQNRPRGDYMMVAGEVPAMDGAAVYIVDTVNQEMMIVAFTQSNNRLTGIGHRNLRQDAGTLARGQQPSR